MRELPSRRPKRHRRDLILAVALVVLGAGLSSLSIPSKLLVTRTLRSSVLLPFLAAHRAFEEQGDLGERVTALEEERNQLSLAVITQSALFLENARLRELLELSPASRHRFVVVELVPGQASVGDSHSFLVRAGLETGISAPVGVGIPEGLVGVIRSVDQRSGYGEFWTHPDFRVGVLVEGGNSTGIIKPHQMETGEKMMLLEGVPFQAEVAIGSAVVTSGESGIYPAGLRVGTVADTWEAKSGWSRSYLVEPSVRPSQTHMVLAWLRGEDE